MLPLVLIAPWLAILNALIFTSTSVLPVISLSALISPKFVILSAECISVDAPDTLSPFISMLFSDVKLIALSAKMVSFCFISPEAATFISRFATISLFNTTSPFAVIITSSMFAPIPPSEFTPTPFSVAINIILPEYIPPKTEESMPTIGFDAAFAAFAVTLLSL